MKFEESKDALIFWLCIVAVLLLCAVTSRAQDLRPNAVTVEMTISDEQSGRPVRANVYVDSKLLHRDVDHCTLIIPADEVMHIIAVQAKGYELFQVGVRARQRQGAVLTAPVKLRQRKIKSGVPLARSTPLMTNAATGAPPRSLMRSQKVAQFCG